MYQAKLISQDEAIYASHAKSRLGKGSADVALPSKIDPLQQTFGLKTIKGEREAVRIQVYIHVHTCICQIGDAASMLVSPPKSRIEVEEESAVGKELYKRSHRDFEVGEMVRQELHVYIQ